MELQTEVSVPEVRLLASWFETSALYPFRTPSPPLPFYQMKPAPAETVLLSAVLSTFRVAAFTR